MNRWDDLAETPGWWWALFGFVGPATVLIASWIFLTGHRVLAIAALFGGFATLPLQSHGRRKLLVGLPICLVLMWLCGMIDGV